MNKKIFKSDIVTSSPSQLQSSTIDLLRFPLAIGVIFIHMNPNTINLLEADFDILSGRGIYNIVCIVFSHVLTQIAVPTFFLISGFLFFVNFQSWSWDRYKTKIYSRIKTLFIPYILWNLVSFLLLLIGMFGQLYLKKKTISDIYTVVQKYSWHIFYDCKEWGTTRVNWLGDNLRMTGPYDLPLWFLRDLIVITLLTPFIYYAVKRLRAFVLFVLFVAYISRIWTLIPGFSITAFFYFTLGAYFALNRLDIVSFVNKYRHVFVSVSIILLIVTTIYDGLRTVVGQNVYPFFIFTGVFTAFYLASLCITKYAIKPNKLLVSSCFFIYAFHVFPIPGIGNPMSISIGIIHIIIPGNSGIEEGLCYVASPFLTAILCLFVLTIVRKIFPQIALLFSGNRE